MSATKSPRVYMTVTRYQTSDGALFEREQDAIARMDELEARDAVEALLRPLPSDDGCAFANGDGFVQQTTKAILALSEYVYKHGGHRSASEHPVASKLQYRLHCIDKLGREWGQPYYAAHPEDGKVVSK